MRRIVLILFCAFACYKANAQDTLSITIAQVQAEFLSKNLSLIAQRYNMDISEALVKQAQIFANPSVGINREFYSGETHRFLKSGNTAEYSLQIQQLFSIAGKRKNLIESAKLGYNLSQLSYLELMRTLKYQVSTLFYQLYFLQQSFPLYQMEEASIEKVVKAYKEQRRKGNVAEKDYLRMVALQESLEHQRLAAEDQQIALQANINTLLCSHGKYYKPLLGQNWQRELVAEKLPSFQAIIDSATANRPDIKMAQTNLLLAQQNVRLQRSLAFPDITIGGNYDRIGGPTKNYIGLTASFELPLFNRNQGNIRSAKAAELMAQTQNLEQYNKVSQEILSSYELLSLYQKSVLKSDPSYMESYKTILNAALQQYLQQNMSLLEFIDLYESYKDNLLQWNDRWMKYFIAKEDLNYKVGYSLVK